ncbi:MAG: outer membrane protein assembly factor BamA [Pyrinomonadaceae bacterium]
MQFFRAFGLVLLSLIFFASHAEARTDDKNKNTAAKPAAVKQQQLVEDVRFEGNRRLRGDDLLYYVKTRKGDVYSPAQLELDLKSLLSLDFFDKVESKVLTEEGERGVKVIFHVKELPVIRDLQFKGLKAVPESDVLKAFREQRVKVSKESVFNPVNAQRGARVIRELLASKGYPNATVTFASEEVSATSTAITYNIDQGNRSRIVDIEFEGLKHFKSSELRDQLQYVKETGLISRFKGTDILDLRKLQADLQRNVRQYMFSKGYFQAQIGDPQVVGLGYKRTGFVPLPLPLVSSKDDTLKVIIPVTEGKIFRAGDVKIEGNSIFSEQVILNAVGLKKGEIVDGKRLQEALYGDESSYSLKKAYGGQGFIQFEADLEPTFKDNPANPNEGIVDVNINIDEGKQFRLHRLEFSGNTFTRDKILRREVLVNEGDIYNQNYVDISVQRLNQLGFFDPIDKDKDVTIRPDEENGDVDLTVAVKEKGRQQISFNGGISGIGGTSFGLQYSTNNLLGRGEVVSFNASIGNRVTDFEVSFQEPYFRNRPIQVGASLILQRYKFFGEGTSLTQNADAINNLINSNFGTVAINDNNLFTQNTYGGSLFATAPLSELFFKKRRFTQFSRLGLTYQFTATTIKNPPVNESGDPTKVIPIVFAQPNIITSRITPTFVYDTRQPAPNGIDTLSGTQLSISLGLAGLGGDVRTYSPGVSYTHFTPMRRKRSKNPEVFGFRILANTTGAFAQTSKIANANSLSFVSGVPFYERYFLGSENDIRGYDSRAIGPIAPLDGYITTKNVVAATSPTDLNPTAATNLNADQSALLTHLGTFTGDTGANPLQTTRTYQIIGGDTQLLGNFEYRIPIFGPASIAAFADIGTVFNLRKGGVQQINSAFLPDQPFLGGSSIGNLLFFSQKNPYQQDVLGGFLVDASGNLVTKTNYLSAYCNNDPTMCAPPPDGTFTSVYLRGQAQTNTRIRVDESVFSQFKDFRSSVGLEFRVQVPIVNVPFRLIYYYNPNAKIGITNEAPGLFLPGKRTGFRFSVGRTF